ncbi:alcohol oxidase [Clavulina sp. PMI_390]|nr:alcohol oxidase [Clavulina sp. PMI_390]
MFFPALLILTFIAHTHAAIYNDPSILADKTYDFIVVGAGATGPILAHRLAEIAEWRVLLVEAGPNDRDYPDIKIPGKAPQLPGEGIAFKYVYEPTPGVANRSLDILRGRTLGGSCAVNLMLQNKGTTEFWDSFAETAEDSSWSYKSMVNTYMKKYENWVTPQAFSDKGKYNPAYHGTSGLINITLSNWKYGIAEAIMRPNNGIPGYEYNEDLNAGNMLGLSWTQSNIGGGARSNPSTGYLHHDDFATSRLNFDVLVLSFVTKINLGETSNRAQIAESIDVVPTKKYYNPNPHAYTIHASREIILSAGALNSPQILMISGIGDPEELSKYSIPTIVENKFVGKDLMDHMFLFMFWSIDTTVTTFDELYRLPGLEDAATKAWYKHNQTGKVCGFMNPCFYSDLNISLAPQHRWLKILLQHGRGIVGFALRNSDGHGDDFDVELTGLPTSDPVWKDFQDPSPGGNSPHWEAAYADGFFDGPLGIPPPEWDRHFITTAFALIAPVARGYVGLRSASPFDDPVLQANFLDNAFDKAVMRDAFKKTRQFVTEAPALRALNPKPYGAQLPIVKGTDGEWDDEQIDRFISENVISMWHPTTSCAVGTCLDSKFIVKGVQNLRVIDMSSFPLMTTGHPMSMLFALAEKAADIIRAQYGKPVSLFEETEVQQASQHQHNEL